MGRSAFLYAASFHEPIDFLALTLLALDPLPLGEVEPKRGRGQAQSTSVQSVSALPLALGSTPPAARAGVRFAWAGNDLWGMKRVRVPVLL